MRAISASLLAVSFLCGCSPAQAPTPTPRPTAPPHVARHAFVAAIPAFRLDGWRSMYRSLAGERREAHWMTYQTAGIATELVWLQEHPVFGSLSISYHEGVEPGRLLERLVESQEPHARWLRSQLAAVHGLREAPEPNTILLDETIDDVGAVRLRYAHAYPIPGEELDERIEMLRWMTTEVKGPRRTAYEASRRRLGVAREIMWLQQDLTGTYSIYYYELAGPAEQLLHEIFNSVEPFDDWFGEVFEQIYDFDRTGQVPQTNEAVIG